MGEFFSGNSGEDVIAVLAWPLFANSDLFIIKGFQFRPILVADNVDNADNADNEKVAVEELMGWNWEMGMEERKYYDSMLHTEI